MSRKDHSFFAWGVGFGVAIGIFEWLFGILSNPHNEEGS
jgi:hypothetical protein